jgi:hypothetical protein
VGGVGEGLLMGSPFVAVTRFVALGWVMLLAIMCGNGCNMAHFEENFWDVL